MKGVYIHIPFCEKRCHYCDFTTMVSFDDDLKKAYLLALEQELLEKLALFPSFQVADTIFIGGGTPTSLSEALLERLLAMVKRYYPTEMLLEYTIECNPNTLTDEKIDLLKHYGVTRLSLGVQSFNDDMLKTLGRAHDSHTVKALVPKLREKGFLRINLDLMYGLPFMSLEAWQESLKTAVNLEVDHLSLYQLKVEEGTAFSKWQNEGAFPSFSEDLASEMVIWHTKYLEKMGYLPYEVSNFAKRGQASLHNQLYWQLYDYLGLGLGATGFVRPLRYTNTSDLKQYLASKGSAREEEVLDLKAQQAETVFMGLRQIKGLSKKRFEDLYQKSLDAVYSEALKKLIQKGLLVEDRDYYHLTERGRLLANEVFMAFI